ncbi:cytochrome c3 family protein [bacterium]|nr:cytochrome c3 family protein [bacterium]
MQKIIILILASIFSFSGFNAFAEKNQEPEVKAKLLKENNCLNCHKNPSGKPEVDKAFLLWDNSSHSNFGLTCDSCHNGDITQKDKEKAHIGILEMDKPKSHVYYLKMDKNCGVCHESEYKDFESSTHYRFLQKGSGPSCISCHDPKSGQILDPDEILASCYSCHNKDLKGYENVPEQAKYVIELTNIADTMINWAEQFIELAKKEGKKTNWATAKLFNAKREVLRAKYWHTFDLGANKEHALNAIKLAKEAKGSLN